MHPLQVRFRNPLLSQQSPLYSQCVPTTPRRGGRDGRDERDPEQRVLHGEDVAAQRVVDVDLHRGVGAQLDHLARGAEQEAQRDDLHPPQGAPAFGVRRGIDARQRLGKTGSRTGRDGRRRRSATLGSVCHPSMIRYPGNYPGEAPLSREPAARRPRTIDED